jgi:hypothetical protein
MLVRRVLVIAAALVPLFAGTAAAAPAEGADGSMPSAPIDVSASAEDEIDNLEATPQAEEALSGATLPPPVAPGRTMCNRLRDLTAKPLNESERRLTLHTLEMLRCPRPAVSPAPPQAGGAGTQQP